MTTRPRGSAVFDATGRYRYRLVRWWGRGPRVAFVMLNPSSADASREDPTIRRCVGFARAWGFGSLEVVNLFGLRTARPRELARAADPVGPENGRHLARAIVRADLVVAAWGGMPLARTRLPFGRLRRAPPMYCLGRTGAGAPRHPLYLRASTRLVRFARARTDGAARSPGAARSTGRGPKQPLPRS